MYLDRNFYAVDILRFLKAHSFPNVIPAKVHRKRIKRLFQVVPPHRSYRTTYTVVSPKDGSEEVNLWIVCCYAKGERGKHKVEHLPYVVIGDLSCPIPNVHKEHHGRFGVESSYRMIDKARARTTCRDPRYRLLLAGLALTFVSLLDHSEVAGVGSAQARGAVD